VVSSSITILTLVAAAGCGGDAFTEVDGAVLDGADDVVNDVASGSDAGKDVGEDVFSDRSMMMVDSSDAIAVSDSSDADGNVCAALSFATFLCYGSTIHAPTKFCSFTAMGSDPGLEIATPIECQCAATYTCACILARVGVTSICPGGQPNTDCRNTNGAISVWCH